MSASGLPVPYDFVTHYGGITFPPENTYTTEMKIDGIKSPDGRTYSAHKIRLGFRFHVHGQSTDAAILNIMQKLSKPGQVFIFGGRGTGPLNINTGKIRDVMYGPWPTGPHLRPLGRNACMIEWAIDVTVPLCADAVYKFSPMSLSYTAEFQIRKDGRTNRIISGELTIPNNRINPNSKYPLDNPDAYRKDIAGPELPGFHREWTAGFKLDSSRTKLAFGWTDFEFGRNIYPPGIVEIKSHQKVTSVPGLAFMKYTAGLSAEYTLAADADPGIAQEHFFNVLVWDRIRSRVGRYKGVAFLPWTFEATDPDSFGETTVCSFSMGYQVIGSSLSEILKHSGMWEVYDKDRGKAWAAWSKSLRNSALNPRGWSKLEFNIRDDEIIDLCKGGDAVISGGRGQVPRSSQLSETSLNSIPPENSWLEWQNAIHVESDTGTVSSMPLYQGTPPKDQELKTVPGTLALPAPPANGKLPEKTAKDEFFNPTNKRGFRPVAGPAPPKGNEPESTPRTGPVVIVYMKGHAKRAGYAIPCPELTKIDGVTVRLANRLDKGEGFVSAEVARTTVPIIHAEWNLRYELSGMPKNGIPLPPNPTL